MDGAIDRRLVSGLLLTGAALAVVGNVAHPFLDPDGGGAELVAAAGEASYWTALHLLIVIATVLLTAGTVLLLRAFAGTAAEGIARAGAIMAVIGGTVFVVQIGGLDSVVMPALADQLAAGADEAAVLAVAEGLGALDVALLGIVTMVYFGGAFVAFGLTMQRTATFAPWIRWTALVAGGAGFLVGILMYLDVANPVAFYGFRLVALAVTVAAIGIGLELRREEAGFAPLARGVPGSPATGQ